MRIINVTQKAIRQAEIGLGQAPFSHAERYRIENLYKLKARRYQAATSKNQYHDGAMNLTHIENWSTLAQNRDMWKRERETFACNGTKRSDIINSQMDIFHDSYII